MGSMTVDELREYILSLPEGQPHIVKGAAVLMEGRAPICREENPHEVLDPYYTFVCTLRKGHTGPHIGTYHSAAPIVQWWRNEEEIPFANCPELVIPKEAEA